jgi:cytochrome P450
MTLPPGPRMPAAMQTVGFWTRPFAFHERCRDRYGSRYTLHLIGSGPIVFLSDPAEVKEMFTAAADALHPGAGMKILEPVVGASSVLLLDEHAHLAQRRVMLPAFHGERIERLGELVAEVAERDIAAWPSSSPVTLHKRLQALTLEVILRAVFGLDPGARLDALRTRLTELATIAVKPLGLISWAQRGPRWRRFLELRAEIDDLVFELVDERRADAADRDDVLAMLLGARHEDGSELSPQELRDELITLLVAGHETTASSLAFAFECLAHSPAVVERLVDEMRAGEEDTYLTATIQEVMRRRPVLMGSAPRIAQRDIEIGGHTYPAGTGITANGYLIHHDAAIYPDPYAFRPERFLEEAPGTYTWIPFGGGRRRCLGASFALLEMRIVLRAALERFELSPLRERAHPPRRRAITVAPGPRSAVVLEPRVAA